jgi:hypothetical protein
MGVLKETRFSKTPQRVGKSGAEYQRIIFKDLWYKCIFRAFPAKVESPETLYSQVLTQFQRNRCPLSLELLYSMTIFDGTISKSVIVMPDVVSGSHDFIEITVSF